MEQDFIDILKKLIVEQKKDALTDALKCRAFLKDYTGSDYRNEAQWILQAVEAGAGKAIDGADDLEACKKAQIKELEAKHGLKPQDAADVVNALALVLRGDSSLSPAPQQSGGAGAPASPAPASPAPVSQSGDSDGLWESPEQAQREADAGKSAEQFRNAAEAGDSAAQYNLAGCYEDGKGVTKDYAQAAKWCGKAAEQGHCYAQYRLGTYYEYGRGVTRDNEKAAYWYGKAAKQGYELAKSSMQSLIRGSNPLLKFLKNTGFEDIMQPDAYTTMSTPMSIVLSVLITACITYAANLFLPNVLMVCMCIISFVLSFLAFRFNNKKLRIILIVIGAVCLAIGVLRFVSK